MKRRRHTPKQIVRKLREGNRMIGQGASIAEVLQHLEITEATEHMCNLAPELFDLSKGR